MRGDREHLSVMPEETVDRLTGGRTGGWYIDGTAGAGGHSARILERAEGSRVLALDRDGDAVGMARDRLAEYGERARVERCDFARMGEAAAETGWDRAELRGVLLDLGVSSMQLDRGERGFSFLREGPLDMRMDATQGESARELLERAEEGELARIFAEYGEERQARRVARAVCRAREEGRLPLTTTGLAELVEEAKGGRRGRTHAATQVFQALRIAVNGELDQLDAALPAAWGLLPKGGRLAVISFHSLEDRRVKRFMQAHEGTMESLAKGGAEWRGIPPRGRRLERKAVTASEEEKERNPRARSAKLRVMEKEEE